MTGLFESEPASELAAAWARLVAAKARLIAADAPSAQGSAAKALDALYGPLARGERWVLGQMGQSLDGCIATRTGASHYVTGPESLVHLHRLRALADAVVVGPNTAAADDPRLTARLVEGPDPVRVVLDLRRMLPPGLRALSGGVLRIVARTDEGGSSPRPGDAGFTDVEVDAPGGRVEPRALLGVLEERGLRRVLVEGGGRLVSSFLRADALDRLHVVVAPLLVGGGVPGVVPAPVDDLRDAVRPASRSYSMGVDVLFDLDLRTPSVSE
ncbi:MAG: RibD family protein [Planctomycetota bacterium]